MGKAFFIDFVRQVIEQTLLEEHIKNPNLVGGDNQLGLFSFYEQLEEQSEVDRYVEKFNQLANQQNRMGLIANGIISSPENPTITNLNKNLIVPLSFICAFRITLEDRDLMLDTINNLIKIRKGRKVDICEFDSGKLFVVGTLANNVDGQPLIRVGDYVGDKPSGTALNTWLTDITIGVLRNLYDKGLTWENFGDRTQYIYYSESGKLKVARYDSSESTWKETNDDGTYDDVIFPPSHNSFTKYKVSISFDALRCETPRSLNGKEVINVSFSGSATIVDEGVLLGNDLTKLALQKYALITSSGEQALERVDYWLEPLEQPSSSSPDTQVNRLISNHFVENTHTDGLSLGNRYTFILDNKNTLLKDLFKYARFGTQTSITPNIIYLAKEIYSSWGEVDVYSFKAKVNESVDIENTESDTMTITIPLQIQGDNN